MSTHFFALALAAIFIFGGGEVKNLGLENPCCILYI